MTPLTPLKRFMASATATTKLERRRGRSLAASRIARLIFLWNFVGFGILAAGALLLSEVRQNLIQAKGDSLMTQGALIVNALAVYATKGEPEPILEEGRAREALRQLRVPKETRVRLYASDGRVVADTDLLADRVVAEPLPPPNQSNVFGPQTLARVLRQVTSITVAPFKPDMSLDEERQSASFGETMRVQRLDEEGARVISISLPVQHVAAVVGVVTVESRDVEDILRAQRVAMIPFILAAAGVTLLSSIFLALQIAQPLRRLAGAADRLRLGFTNRLEAPDVALRSDEIGDLAQALERMTAALLERIEANERFAADVAHEIKNPLTSIRSAVETAGRVSDPVSRARLLGIIAQDVGRLDRLVTDISSASRIEAETARGAPVPIDLARMLPELTEIYEQTKRDGEVSVLFKWPAPKPAIVIGQEGPLGQVFRNLIDNAKSFSPEIGDVTVYILEIEGKEGRRLRVHVDDAGPGVPSDNLTTIFERFYTDRPKGAAFGGNSGLGLSIARSIVEAHKGRIWAENIPGPQPGVNLGARFIVELPAAPAA
jgi:two-component system sensor histidine kinase ChvG